MVVGVEAEIVSCVVLLFAVDGRSVSDSGSDSDSTSGEGVLVMIWLESVSVL